MKISRCFILVLVLIVVMQCSLQPMSVAGVETVDTSDYEVPYSLFQASFYKENFESGFTGEDHSYASTYFRLMEADEEIQESILTWEVVHMAADPAGTLIGEKWICKQDLYKLALYDILGAPYSNNNAYDGIVTYAHSFVNDFMDAVLDVVEKPYLKTKITAANKAEVTAILKNTAQASNMMDCISFLEQIIEVAATFEDAVRDIAHLQTICSVDNTIKQILMEIALDYSNPRELRLAAEECVIYFSVDRQTAVNLIIQKATLKSIATLCKNTAWELTKASIPFLVVYDIAMQGMMAITDGLFALDATYEQYYMLETNTALEGAFLNVMQYCVTDFMFWQDEQAANYYMCAVDLYKRTVLNGMQYAKKLLQIQAEAPAYFIMSMFQLFDENSVTMRCYQEIAAIENIEANKRANYNAFEQATSDTYHKLYGPVESWDVSVNQDGSVIATVYGMAEEGYKIVVSGDGAIKDFQYIDDIPWKAYYENETLPIIKLTVKNGITHLGNYAFCKNPGLMTVNLPISLKTIGKHTFNACTKIEEIEIPDSVTKIGSYAFYGCSAMHTVIMGSGVEKIEEYGFSWCTFMTRLFIKDLSAWCQIHFENVAANPLANGGYLYMNEEKVTDLVLPDDIATVTDFALHNFGKLSSITIPNNITDIGKGQVLSDTLTTIHINTNHPAFTLDSSGVLYNKSKTKVILAPRNLSGTYQVPNGVTTIGSAAFARTGNLQTVKLPASVRYIQDYAFFYCEKLTTVNLGGNLVSVGDYAFSDCEELTELIMPNSLRSIGQWAYANCKNLRSIWFRNGIQEIGEYAFYYCSALTQLTFPESLNSIGHNAFTYCLDLHHVFFKGDAPQIGEEPFFAVTICNAYYPAGNKTWTEEKQESFNPLFAWQPIEYISHDWTNMYVDTNSVYCNVEFAENSQIKKDQDKLHSLGLKAPEDQQGKITFNPARAVTNRDLENSVNMNGGILGAWFYFGNMTPEASLMITESFEWNQSFAMPFTFGSVGADGWCYGTVDCSKHIYPETYYPGYAARFTIVLPAGFDGCIDEMTFSPANIPAPQQFSTAHLPADPNDLFANAKPANMLDFFHPEKNLTQSNESGKVNGGSSTRSWVFKAGTTEGEWPTATINLQKAYDMRGKVLAMDVFIDDATPYLSIVSLHDPNWLNLNVQEWPANYIEEYFDVQQWVTLYFDLDQNISEGKDLSTVQFIKLGFSFEVNKGMEQAVYIDNVRIIDPEDVPKDPVEEGDMLSGTDSIVYQKLHWENWDDSVYEEEVVSGLTCGVDTEHIYGKKSSRSWYFTAAPEADLQNAIAQLQLDQTYDVTGKYLIFEAKLVSDMQCQQEMGIRLHDSAWGNLNDVNAKVKLTPGDWQTVIVGFEDLYNTNAALTDLSLISFYFDFQKTAGYERTIYIDNVRLAEIQEEVAEDLINIPHDTGVYSTSEIYGQNGFRSLRINALSAMQRVTFVPEESMDMSDGVLSGWFYYGDQLPGNVRIVFYNGTVHSGYLTFTFGEESVNGWYLGTVDLSDVADNRQEILNAIDKMYLTIPAGAEVFVDNLKFYGNNVPEADKMVSQWNVVLNDALQVNFHLRIGNRIASAAQIHLTVGDWEMSCPVSQLTGGKGGVFVLPVTLAAAQMTDPIQIQIINQGESSEVRSYTVRQYMDTVLADNTMSQYHSLIRATLHYGAATQSYFQYQTDRLANENLDAAEDVSIPEYDEEKVIASGRVKGVCYYGASLLHKEKLAVRFYFLVDGNIDEYDFAINGVQVSPVSNQTMCYIEMPGINPYELDQEIHITVTDDGGSIAIQYCPMDYIIRMNLRGDDLLRVLLKALYQYYQAAKDLVETTA